MTRWNLELWDVRTSKKMLRLVSGCTHLSKASLQAWEDIFIKIPLTWSKIAESALHRLFKSDWTEVWLKLESGMERRERSFCKMEEFKCLNSGEPAIAPWNHCMKLRHNILPMAACCQSSFYNEWSVTSFGKYFCGRWARSSLVMETTYGMCISELGQHNITTHELAWQNLHIS